MIQIGKIIKKLYTLDFNSQRAVGGLVLNRVNQGELFAQLEQLQNSLVQESGNLTETEQITQRIIELARNDNDLSLEKFRTKVATLMTPKALAIFRRFSGYFYHLYQGYRVYYAYGTLKKEALAFLRDITPKDLPAIIAQKKLELHALSQKIRQRFDRPTLTPTELSALQKHRVFQGKALSLLTRRVALDIIRRQLTGYQILENESEKNNYAPIDRQLN